MTNFDEAASTWDSPMRRERALKLAEAIREAWGDAPRAVLDFGCGTGLIAFGLFPCAAELFGYEPSAEMRRVFEAKREALRADNVRLVSPSEMRARSYDAIYSSMVFHHIPDVRAEIAGLKRLLAPGGRFLWIDLDQDDGSFHGCEPGFDGHDGFARGEVEDMLKGAGFREVSVRTAYQGEKPAAGGPIPYSLFIAAAR